MKKLSEFNIKGYLLVAILIPLSINFTYASESKEISASLQDFPTLHPLIVHFAIVLLIVGSIIQMVNVYFLKKELAWISFCIILIGFITAYLASRNFHPHTHGLTEQAKLVLEQHDFWADWTINLSLTGLVLQAINFFYMRYKRWAMAIVTIVLIGAGYSVAQAGHFGSQLVHIEGVGPQGNFLEIEGHEDSH